MKISSSESFYQKETGNSISIDAKNRLNRNIPCFYGTLIRQRNLFTLIELLVVIAIISILVAILLPALKSARDYAKSIVCLGNLKQMGVVDSNYSQDFGCFIPFYNGVNGYTSGMSASWWNNLCWEQMGVPAASATQCDQKWPVDRLCPASAAVNWESSNPFYIWIRYVSYSYGMNNEGLYATNKYNIYDVRKIKDPSKSFHFADGCNNDLKSGKSTWYNYAITGSPAAGKDIYVNTGGYAVNSQDVMYFRHNKGANLLYFDSHASWNRHADVEDNASQLFTKN